MHSSCHRGFSTMEGEGTRKIETLTHLKASFLMVSVSRILSDVHIYKLKHMQISQEHSKGKREEMISTCMASFLCWLRRVCWVPGQAGRAAVRAVAHSWARHRSCGKKLGGRAQNVHMYLNPIRAQGQFISLLLSCVICREIPSDTQK